MAQPIITIAQGAVSARIVTDDKRVHTLAQQILSFTVDGAEHMGNVGSAPGQWDGRSSFYNFNTGLFPAGFVVKMYRELRKRDLLVNIVRKPLPPPLGEKNPKVDEFPEDPRYDYQAQVVDLLERYGQIIAQVATGGGKSRIAKLAVMRIKRPTLFLTTRAILMHQMRNAFIKDLRTPVGIYGDGENSGEPQLMNVGMVQTFSAWIAEPDPSDSPAKNIRSV